MAEDVTLRELTDEEYAEYRDYLRRSYIDEMVTLGRWDRASAERRAERANDDLPASGPPDGQTIRVVAHQGNQIGHIWVGPAKDGDPDAPIGQRFGWLNDIEVDEPLRGQGWGRVLLAAAEQLARDEGYGRLGLNVFGGNDRAIRLYVSDGFEVMNQLMVKDL